MTKKDRFQADLIERDAAEITPQQILRLVGVLQKRYGYAFTSVVNDPKAGGYLVAIERKDDAKYKKDKADGVFAFVQEGDIWPEDICSTSPHCAIPLPVIMEYNPVTDLAYWFLENLGYVPPVRVQALRDIDELPLDLVGHPYAALEMVFYFRTLQEGATFDMMLRDIDDGDVSGIPEGETVH